jgi:hypothetical protein
MKISDLEISIATALQTHRFIMASDMKTLEILQHGLPLRNPETREKTETYALKTPRKGEQAEASAPLQIFRLETDHSLCHTNTKANKWSMPSRYPRKV